VFSKSNLAPVVVTMLSEVMEAKPQSNITPQNQKKWEKENA
jgi:hypothetical protein